MNNTEIDNSILIILFRRKCLPGCTIGGVRNVDDWQQLINRTPIKHEMSVHLSIDFEFIFLVFFF